MLSVPPGTVLIPGGPFRMGSPDSPDAQPVRPVFVSPFYMATLVATNQELNRHFEEKKETPDVVFWHRPDGVFSLLAWGKGGEDLDDRIREMASGKRYPSFRRQSADLVSGILRDYAREPYLFAPTAAYLVFSDYCQEHSYDPFLALIQVLREMGASSEVVRVIPESRELPKGFDHLKKPAININWYEAVAYAAAQRVFGNRCMRLPTEAEWEKAARGGKGYEHGTSTGEISRELAHYHRRSTSLVGKYPPNPYGLYDMAGNVWQWCLDWHQNNYQNLPDRDPIGPPTGNWRVRRGGSWYDDDPGFLRSAYRGGDPPADRFENVGVRLAVSAQDSSNFTLGSLTL